MSDTISLLHLVNACRTDKERAELSLLLANAALALAATVENEKTGTARQMLYACREACVELVELTDQM